jgi:8-oxo-dGTP pyrophosphatase MutT (NUDIX family)
MKFLNENAMHDAGIVVCINDNNEILILRRAGIDNREGQWTLPGGHVDEEDASIEASAARELFEEANLRCAVSDLNYLGEPKSGKYYFWTQHWTGDVNVDKPNPDSGEIEHDDYKWSSIEEIKDIDDTEIPIYLLEKALEMVKNAK